MQEMSEETKQNRQEAKFVFGDEELLAEITWYEGSADFDVRFMDPNSGWQNSNPASARNGWYYQDAEANENYHSLVNAVQQWDDWSDFLNWSDGAVDVFEFEWDGKSFGGFTDMEGNPEYKELTRK